MCVCGVAHAHAHAGLAMGWMTCWSMGVCISVVLVDGRVGCMAHSVASWLDQDGGEIRFLC